MKEIIPVYDIDFKRKIINKDSAWRFIEEVELLMYSGICDQKGNKIFQGDIVADRRYDDVYYTVEFKNGMFTIDGLNLYECSKYMQLEIVGNKFEGIKE